jgi:hypothetical protein
VLCRCTKDYRWLYNYAAIEFIVDKINNTSANILLKSTVPTGLKFWLKNHFNSADYQYPAKGNQAIICVVDVGLYAGINAVAGDIYTSTQVLDGAAALIQLTMKGKYYFELIIKI